MFLKSPFPDVPSMPALINTHQLLFHRPEQAKWQDYTFHIDPKTGMRTTYSEFVARLQLAMTALGAPEAEGGLGLGTEKDGEMIGIISSNSLDYITLVHCLLGITTPFSPISSYSTPFELKHALELVKCTRIFVSAQALPVVMPLATKLGIPSSKIYVLGEEVKGRKTFAELIAVAQRKKIPTVTARPATKSTLAFLIFSSGTTGLPKAVMISQGNIAYTIMQTSILGKLVAETLPPLPPNTPLPVALGFLPLNHCFGLFHYAFRPFLQPTTYVLLPHWDIELVLKVIPKYKISQMILVPSLVLQLVNHPDIRNVDLSSLQSIGSGAAHLSRDLFDKAASIMPKGAGIFQGYGMSECTVACVMQVTVVPGSVGVLLPGQEAHIIRDDGTEADVDEVGGLYIRGGNVAMGYLDNEKATRETFMEDGWLRTGDRFKVDKDGNFYFIDREKDTLKVSGSQVSPTEIEIVLRAHPKGLIDDVIVAGVSGGHTPDEKVPRAWLVLSDAGSKMGAEGVKRELEAWTQDNLSRHKWLRGGIQIVAEIPKSMTGKVLRRVLQDQYERQAARNVKGKL